MVLQLNILKLTSPKDLIEIGLVVLEKNILRFHQWFFTISKLSPLRKRWALHLNYFKSPSPKDALCQVWLKLVKWFLRRRFSYIVNVFSLFRNYLPLEKDGPFFKHTWIPFTQGCNVPSLIEIIPVVLGKKIFKFRQCIFAIS